MGLISQCGYVIGLRLPMVEIAADVGSRWMPISDLVPEGTRYKSCPMSDRQVSDIKQAREDCEAGKHMCLANCFGQMTTTDLAAPSNAQLLCRGTCEKLQCE